MKSRGGLRLDARLDRPRRGRARPTSRSSTWPRCAPSRAWPMRPARRRQRDRVRLAGDAGERPEGPKGLALTRQNLPVLEGTSAEGVARGGYVLADASGGEPAADPHRHRLGAADRGRGPRGAGGRRRPHPGGLDAVRGVVRRAGRGVPRVGAAAGGAGPGQRRGRHRACRGTGSPATPARSSPSSTSAPARTTRRCSASSASPPSTWSPPPARSLGQRLLRSGARLSIRTRGAVMSNERLAALAAAGVSIWLDDLSRERLTSGNLQELITDKNVVGVTTNPTIFAAALAERARPTTRRSASWPPAARRSTTPSARSPWPTSSRPATCSAAPGRRTGGVDGRVSLEVDPRLARDTEATVAAGAGPVEGRRPAEPAGQDPGHRGGPAGDHPRAGRGRQRERHADLLGRALPRR